MKPTSEAGDTASLILVVDDDVEVRDAIRDVLEDEGFTIETASNGKEALDTLARDAIPDAIVLDLTMPVMDGHEFLRRQAADRRLKAIPVIVVTASMPTDLPAEVHLVRKPIDVDTLVNAVRTCTG